MGSEESGQMLLMAQDDDDGKLSLYLAMWGSRI